LSEADFVDFWCIYLVSLAHEHFIKDQKYARFLSSCHQEVQSFKRVCQLARIPEIRAKKTLREILEWALDSIYRRIQPKVTYNALKQEGSLELFASQSEASQDVTSTGAGDLPQYVGKIQEALDAILVKADLYLWLMVDRLDEVFPRRSKTETKALRGLLRTLQILSSERIRIKIFLRDDILGQIAGGSQGFTGLTHITARQADRLQWSEDQILTLVVRRLAASEPLREYLKIDPNRLAASPAYQKNIFYRVFPETVHSKPNQSSTLKWIYAHTKDGRDVVN
jgi:hypothetical protein